MLVRLLFAFLFCSASLVAQDEEVTYRVRIFASDLVQKKNGREMPGEARIRLILTDREGNVAMTGKQINGSFGTVSFRDYPIAWPVATVELAVEGIYWTRRIEVEKISITMIDEYDDARSRMFEGGVTLTPGNSVVTYDRAGPIGFEADREFIAQQDAEDAALDLEGAFESGPVEGNGFVIESQNRGKAERELQTIKEENDGKRICKVTTHEASASFDVSFLTNPSMSSIYPGALITGESIADGTYVNIPAKRRPITVSTDLAVIGSPMIEIENPKLSTSRQAITDLLVAQVKGDMEVQVNFEIKEVYSKEQLSIALGGHFEYGAAAMEFDFGYDSESEKTVKVVKFQQIYYTLDMDQPDSPFDLFREEKDALRVLRSGEVPLVVSTVTYGRVAYFFMRTDASTQEIQASLDASYNGGKIKAGGNASLQMTDILQRSETSALIIGGSGADGIQAIDGYDGFMNMLRDGGNFSGTSVGKPISYTLRYLEDWSIARVNLATTYTKRECRDVAATSETIEIAFEKIAMPSMYEDGSEIVYYFNIQLLIPGEGLSNIIIANNKEASPLSFTDNSSERVMRKYGSFTYDFDQIDEILINVSASATEVDQWPDANDALGLYNNTYPLRKFLENAQSGGTGMQEVKLTEGEDEIVFYYSAKPKPAR